MEGNYDPQQAKLLNELGLQGNETTVYLTLLSLGTNPVSTLAKKAGLNRCTCYAIIERLIQKGFIGQIIKSNIAYFTAVEPYYLLTNLKTKHLELEKRINILGKSINNLNQNKKDHHNRPKVVLFEGKSGLCNILEDTLRSGNEIRIFASLNDLHKLLPDYIPGYHQRLNKTNLTVKAIYPASELSYYYKLKNTNQNIEYQLIPPEYNFQLNNFIFENKVAMMSPKANFGIVIENKDMFEAQKRFFDFFWTTTRIYDQIMTKIMEEKIAFKKAPNNNPEPFIN